MREHFNSGHTVYNLETVSEKIIYLNGRQDQNEHRSLRGSARGRGRGGEDPPVDAVAVRGQGRKAAAARDPIQQKIFQLDFWLENGAVYRCAVEANL